MKLKKLNLINNMLIIINQNKRLKTYLNNIKKSFRIIMINRQKH